MQKQSLMFFFIKRIGDHIGKEGERVGPFWGYRNPICSILASEALVNRRSYLDVSK
jgi:hypothetical protein